MSDQGPFRRNSKKYGSGGRPKRERPQDRPKCKHCDERVPAAEAEKCVFCKGVFHAKCADDGALFDCDSCKKTFCVECCADCEKCEGGKNEEMCKECVEHCSYCGEDVCKDHWNDDYGCCKGCTRECDCCGAGPYSPEDTDFCEHCEHYVCDECYRSCDSCRYTGCEKCVFEMDGCNHEACPECSVLCAGTCERNFCRECLDDEGFCEGCAHVCDNCGERAEERECVVCDRAGCKECVTRQKCRCYAHDEECHVQCPDCEDWFCKNHIGADGLCKDCGVCPTCKEKGKQKVECDVCTLPGCAGCVEHISCGCDVHKIGAAPGCQGECEAEGCGKATCKDHLAEDEDGRLTCEKCRQGKCPFCHKIVGETEWQRGSCGHEGCSECIRDCEFCPPWSSRTICPDCSFPITMQRAESSGPPDFTREIVAREYVVCEECVESHRMLTPVEGRTGIGGARAREQTMLTIAYLDDEIRRRDEAEEGERRRIEAEKEAARLQAETELREKLAAQGVDYDAAQRCATLEHGEPMSREDALAAQREAAFQSATKRGIEIEPDVVEAPSYVCGDCHRDLLDGEEVVFAMSGGSADEKLVGLYHANCWNKVESARPEQKDEKYVQDEFGIERASRGPCDRCEKFGFRGFVSAKSTSNRCCVDCILAAREEKERERAYFSKAWADRMMALVRLPEESRFKHLELDEPSEEGKQLELPFTHPDCKACGNIVEEGLVLPCKSCDIGHHRWHRSCLASCSDYTKRAHISGHAELYDVQGDLESEISDLFDTFHSQMEPDSRATEVEKRATISAIGARFRILSNLIGPEDTKAAIEALAAQKDMEEMAKRFIALEIDEPEHRPNPRKPRKPRSADEKFDIYARLGKCPVRWSHHPKEIKEVLKAIHLQPMMKECFSNTQRFMLHGFHMLPDVEYHEGWVVGAPVPFPFIHAWLVWQGKIIDLTLDDNEGFFYDPARSYAVPREEIVRALATRGWFGAIRGEQLASLSPWENLRRQIESAREQMTEAGE